jgi:hypothetical protein
LNEKYEFSRAVVFARKIDVKKVPVSGSSSHRQQYAKLDDGYFIIEQKWYPATPKK